MQKGKWLPEEALQIVEKRREAKGKGEKEKYTISSGWIFTFAILLLLISKSYCILIHEYACVNTASWSL